MHPDPIGPSGRACVRCAAREPGDNAAERERWEHAQRLIEETRVADAPLCPTCALSAADDSVQAAAFDALDDVQAALALADEADRAGLYRAPELRAQAQELSNDVRRLTARHWPTEENTA